MGNKVKKIFMRRGVPRLPDAYQEVEYIQGSGTQYIILGTSVKTSYKSVIDLQLTATGGDHVPLGTRDSSYKYGIDVYNSKFTVISGGSSWTATITEDTERHTITIDKSTAIVDGTSYSCSYVSRTINYGMGVFCYNDIGSAGYIASMKLYKLDIYDENGTHIYDLVPCYRKSDNVIGMYDLVNDQFYTNSGSGSFTKGADSSTLVYKEFQVWPEDDDQDVYYSDRNRDEYQRLVNSVGSVIFVDTGERYRFDSCCYIGDRIAINVSGTRWDKVNLDTLTVVSTKTLGDSIGGRFWYFGENRILTRRGILDFEGNFITTFSYTFNSITLGLPGVVWANVNYGIYKGIVNGDNITFTKVGTGSGDQGVGLMFYGRLGAYLINSNDTSGSGYSSYINPDTNTISNFKGGDNSRQYRAVSGADGKLYRWAARDNGWGRFQKIGTGSEGFVGDTLSTSWLLRGCRLGKFLGNIVSGGMNTQNGTGNGYGSNNYFVNTSGTLTLVQSNALAYDTNIYTHNGFIDENGWIYPQTDGGGSGVILKTDKTFTNFNWKNPYLYR